MASMRPPAYAWDWFSRQRLLWRETRTRLASAPGATAERYGPITAKPDVLARLRDDYAEDADVRATIHAVVTDIAFLGRTDRPYADLGLRTAPRGLRWWWTALTDEELEPPEHPVQPAAPEQLRLDDLATGYGDRPH